MGLSRDIYVQSVKKKIDSFSNLTSSACDDVYDNGTMAEYWNCMDSVDKTAESGSKWRDVLNNALIFGNTVVGQSGQGGGSSERPPIDNSIDDKKKNTGVYVVVGLGVVALVGFGLYKLSTKK